jgi:hypothetical protein
MSTAERINERFPRFYRNWDKGSIIALLLQSISEQLDEAESGITNLMQAHWIDTAHAEDLEKIGALVESKRIPEESDEHFRTRLKRAVDEFKGGGTVSVILGQISQLINAKSKEVEIIENPLVEDSAEFSVIANDSWTLGSNSIEGELPTISLTVEDKGEVSNPQITNIDTGQVITFEGKLKTGEQLVIKQGSALIDQQDVTENLSSKEIPELPRKLSTWKYSEALLERIGVFDSAVFDEHTFAVGVPTVRVRFEWTKRRPATFVVQIKERALRDSGISESYLEEAVKSMKAAGVNAIIKVME